jgi:hypothetical protein
MSDFAVLRLSLVSSGGGVLLTRLDGARFVIRVSAPFPQLEPVSEVRTAPTEHSDNNEKTQS